MSDKVQVVNKPLHLEFQPEVSAPSMLMKIPLCTGRMANAKSHK